MRTTTTAMLALVSAFLFGFGLVELGTVLYIPGAAEADQEGAENLVLAKPESIQVVPSPFLQKHQELQQLLYAHQQPNTTLNETAQLLTTIIEDPKYHLDKPNSSILFIKTHKTGSSTITSILHSIATAHKGLTAPVSHISLWEFHTAGEKIRNLRTNQRDRQGAPFDIWPNHVEFHEYLLKDIIKEGTTDRYFTILRDPGTRHRSGAGFTDKCTPGVDGIINSSTWTEWVLNNATKSGQFGRHCEPEFTTMQVVGAFPNNTKLFPQQRQVAYERARNGNLLLLVTERMDESLLLLRDYYQLHPLDVTFFAMKINNNDKKKTEETKERLEALQRMRELNPEDVMMYQFANNVMDERMEKVFPNSILRQQAIKERQQLNDIVSEVCLDVLGEDPFLMEYPPPRVHLDYEALATRAANYRTPLLGYWCLEKRLDEWEWNRFHLQRLNSTTTIDYYDTRG